jgi:hypothetical protein
MGVRADPGHRGQRELDQFLDQALFSFSHQCAVLLFTKPNPQNHGQNAHTRHDLDKRVRAKAKEDEGLIADAEENGHESLSQIVGDGEDCQPEGVAPVAIGNRFAKACNLYSCG